MRPGDTLWAFAVASLPADADPARVARVCARWYRVNQTTIGADPDLLIPGTWLRPPPGTTVRPLDRRP